MDDNIYELIDETTGSGPSDFSPPNIIYILRKDSETYRVEISPELVYEMHLAGHFVVSGSTVQINTSFVPRELIEKTS